jgi:chromosomal replication initiation ATPase DnaA
MKVPIQVINDIISKRELVESNGINDRSRRRIYCLPRQIVMTLALEEGYSLYETGKFFGKDHATPVHARKAIYALYDTDKEFKKRFDFYRKLIKRDINIASRMKLSYFAIEMNKRIRYVQKCAI